MTSISPSTATLPADRGRVAPADGDPQRLDAFLPSPCVQNHAAHITALRNGDLACVWFGGTQEGIAGHLHLVLRLAVGSDRWTAPSSCPTIRPARSRTPCCSRRRTERCGCSIRRRSPATRTPPSCAAGPRPTTDGPGDRSARCSGRGPGRHLHPPAAGRPPQRRLAAAGVPLPRDAGREVGGRPRHQRRQDLDDQGRTWTEHPVPDSTGCVHMNIVPLRRRHPGRLVPQPLGRRDLPQPSTTTARTWSAPVPTELPNNNSSIQLTALRDGRLAWCSTKSSAEGVTERRLSLYDEIEDDDAPGTGGTGARRAVPVAGQSQGRKTFWGAPRAPMTLALSSDGGITWPVRRNLEVGDGYCMTNNSRKASTGNSHTPRSPRPRTATCTLPSPISARPSNTPAFLRTG